MNVNVPTSEPLEEAIYRASLADGNPAIRSAPPWVTWPLTILSYGLLAGTVLLLAAFSSAPSARPTKTISVDLTESIVEAPPPVAPPPPPPPPPAAAVKVTLPKAPKIPLPLPDIKKEVAPEEAPKVLPKEDHSLAYQDAATGPANGVPGGVTGGATGGVVGGTGKGPAPLMPPPVTVVELERSEVVISYQPPVPPYPPLARRANIRGDVIVDLTVGQDGIPLKAQATQGPSILRPSAEQYALEWRFIPPKVGGIPQKSHFHLTIQFRFN